MKTGIHVLIQPSFQRVGDSVRAMTGQTVRHDQDSGMEPTDLEPGDRQADEIVAVPSDQDPAFRGSKVQLVGIWISTAIDLMDGDHVETEAAGDLRHVGTEILVQEEAHHQAGSAVARLCERELAADSLWSPLSLSIEARLDLLRVDLVVRQRRAELRLRQPGIASPQTNIVPAVLPPGGDDLPDIETCPRHDGPASGGTIHE